MHSRNIFLRISKFLGKAILGLLLVVLTVVALIHLPPIQRQLTGLVSNYLSSKIDARVDIGRIDFSILGNVAIQDLKVWDPDKAKIFSALKIEVSSSIFDLGRGDLTFDEIRIAGVDGQLAQREDGLNIQFILDAFRSKERGDTKPGTVKLQFKSIILEDIVFDFTSAVNGTTFTGKLGKFTSQDAEVFINPTKISAGKVYLENTAINILSTQHQDTINQLATSKSNNLFRPDFGTGIVFEIKDVELKNNDFSFHRNQVTNTPKFDPHHIGLKNIQLRLTDIVIGEDTLAAALQVLSTQLPGFKLADARADIKMNRNLLVLSKLHLASNTNELNADLTGGYDLKSAEDEDHVHVEIAAQCRINPADFAYFFSDSLMNHFNHWKTTALEVEGNYTLGKGVIKTLNLKTVNSQLQAEGMVQDALDLEKIYWKDIMIRASIGSDFNRTISPFLKKIKVPTEVTLQMNSSGNLKKVFLDGKVFTPWGDVRATGFATQPVNNIGIDMNLTGEKVDLGKWMELSWLGPINLAVDAKGIISDDPDVEIKGLINSIEIQDEPIRKITFQSKVRKNNSSATISIEDPKYRSEIISEFSYASPLLITTEVRFNDFSAGTLLHADSTLSISGGLKSKIKIDHSSVEGYVEGDSILFKNQSMQYLLDTLAFHAMMSPTTSDFEYYTDYEKAKLVSNFDIRDSRKLIQSWSKNMVKLSDSINHPPENRALDLNLELQNAGLFQLLGIGVDDFSSMSVTGELNEKKHTLTLQATSGNLKGYGVSLDTLNTNIIANRDSVSAGMNVQNVFYNSIQLGNLDFDVFTKGDTAFSNLLLSHDSITTLGLGARIFRADSGVFVYPDKLKAFERNYFVDQKNPVYIDNKNIVLEDFVITRDDMQISLDGDLSTFDINLKNVDLTPLNYLLDSTVINKGHLTGRVLYARDQQLDLNADIDSLSLYNSNPLTIGVTARRDGNQVPFKFLLTNEANKIDMKGQYYLNNREVDAALILDVNNLELFAFLVSGVIDEMNGTLKGEAKISGPIQKPVFKGHLRFLNVGFTTVNPTLTFNVRDDIITLDNSALLLDDFTLYDKEDNPLTIDGNLTSKDYQSFTYDLQINSDQYTLFNKPDSASGRLKGVLVIASDIKLKGNEKDTNVEAKITVKAATNLTFVTSNDDIELLKSEGIVDFIDPKLLLETTASELSSYFYDSLIASLPDFNLNSTVTLEDDAVMRLIIDAQSGDFIEASGGANLELGYDRTGNLHLSGNYTIKKGVYRLSFYDLVKKNFTLVQGSSVNWSGIPENGELDLKAVHTVESNSIGLIGHEIGENEKSIYKRSLDYEVGINIKGTIEKPIISFSLDLPKEEKVNYPVLANKLDRLRLPEYESELNKQVFGLLVLGGFLPETSGSDINSNLIATTALSNSVNSLLASQLNRFASQYVKGVNIDVGIQSYSDYSAPGGKTQTAMDFRVSKSILNDRLSFEIGGDFDINQDQSGANTGNKNYRGDIAIIYDLTGGGDKQLKLFNNETYDIIYQEIRNTGISLIFIREFDKNKKRNNEDK